MIQEVARSYAELPNLGFTAFDSSEAYQSAKKKIKHVRGSKVVQILHIDYQNTVTVRDLLGQPTTRDRKSALCKLRSLGLIDGHDVAKPPVPPVPVVHTTLLLFVVAFCVACLLRDAVKWVM